jgi:hypothetical protein
MDKMENSFEALIASYIEDKGGISETFKDDWPIA